MTPWRAEDRAQSATAAQETMSNPTRNTGRASSSLAMIMVFMRPCSDDSGLTGHRLGSVLAATNDGASSPDHLALNRAHRRTGHLGDLRVT
jgi:hypothetical protein